MGKLVFLLASQQVHLSNLPLSQLVNIVGRQDVSSFFFSFMFFHDVKSEGGPFSCDLRGCR